LIFVDILQNFLDNFYEMESKIFSLDFNHINKNFILVACENEQCRNNANKDFKFANVATEIIKKIIEKMSLEALSNYIIYDFDSQKLNQLTYD